MTVYVKSNLFIKAHLKTTDVGQGAEQLENRSKIQQAQVVKQQSEREKKIYTNICD